MSRLFKKFDSKAQSTFEYTIIVTLVAAAIIIAGPYVIRSWNAYLRTTEASLHDSLYDPFEEADSGLVDLPSCECGDWYETVCGDSFEGENCAIFKKGLRRDCTGSARVCEEQGYDIFRCTQDSSCCTEWAEGPCGVNADPDCPDGEKQWARECGNYGNWEYECRVDTDCDFHCEMAGDWPKPGTYELCKDSGYDPNDESQLPGDTNYTFVEDGRCHTNIKCEIECQAPALVRGNGCGCPTGSVYQGECSEGYCRQGSCSGGYCER